MIWTTWRQERIALLTMGVILLVLVAYMAVTGIHLNTAVVDFRHSCLSTGNRFSTTCIQLGRFVNEAERWWFGGFAQKVDTGAALAIPGLFGVALGAPLVAREIDAKTNRIAWTQSVSHFRWVTTKIAFLAVCLVAMVLAADAVLQWWLNIEGPGILNGSNLGWSGYFDISGVVVVAYALFAFALGVAVGAVIRRTVWAAVTSLGAFAAVRWYIARDLRSGYMAPVVSRPSALNGPTYPSDAWQVGSGYLHAGMSPSVGNLVRAKTVCMTRLGSGYNGYNANSHTDACMRALGFRNIDLFQPAHRFWAFQGIESAIFIAMAAALVAFTYWLLRRQYL